ncbi:MAG: DinB family protein [Bacteroidota bacterium]
MESYPVNQRNKVKRVPRRGHYDRETVHRILDIGCVAHIGFVVDGQPFVIPTAYGRSGDRLYLHGATKSRMMTNLEEGIPVCVTVTYLDGIVLARSAFHHSMNYRSAVIFGKAHILEGAEKEKALFCISEQILKGRWAEVRQPSEKEMKATMVLALTIDQASAKIRTGPPGDDLPDYELPIWAGVLPIHRSYGQAISDPKLRAGIPLPASVKNQLQMNQTASTNLRRPEKSEVAEFYWGYVEKVPGNDFLQVLRDASSSMPQWFEALDADQWNYRYAEGKWTVKEVLQHLIDTERIFNYRALRIARGDKTPLPGFDHNAYVPASNANSRSPESLMAEYRAVRAASIVLFETLDHETLNQKGTASEKGITVRGLGYITAGHEIHHLQILKERYFNG